MSSTSEATRKPGPFLRRHLPTIASGLVLLSAVTASLVGGCIRRVPAPTDDAPADSPYSAVATWRDISLPALPQSGGVPLPEAALRLAIGPDASIWMDSALVDGRESALIHEDLAPALRALEGRAEDIVLIGFDPSLCAALRPLGERLIVAAGTSSFKAEGTNSRAKAETLLGIPLASLCSAGEPVD